MPRADAESNNAYKKKNAKQIRVWFYPTDMCLHDYAKSHDNVAGYIKGLIAADMESNGAEVIIKERRPTRPKKED